MSYAMDGELSPHDLKDLLALLGPTRDLKQAMQSLDARYGGTDRIRKACDEIDAAIAKIRTITS